MPDITDTRRANLEQLIARLGSADKVAAAANTNPVYLSQLRTRAVDRKTGRERAMGSRLARAIEVALSLPAGWMDQPHDQATETPQLRGESVAINSAAPVSTSLHITWGAIMRTPLPEVFSTEMPDDSMSPRVRRGDRVRFNSALRARPGDGVLVSDHSGELYFRVYRARRVDQWEAYALNPAYQPLDSSRDNLVVVAVLVGIEYQRWS